MSSEAINTHNLRIGFGRHKGELWTRVPVSYLKWLVNSDAASENGRIAKAELDRRGTVTPDFEVSGHAIDRASLECRAIWHETANSPNEGLHAWLIRMAKEALRQQPDEKGRRYFAGMWFAFEDDGCWPVLKTVHRIKEKDDGKTLSNTRRPA